MKEIKFLLLTAMFAVITSVSFAQGQPDIKQTVGERTYADLNPATVAEVMSGMRTYQAWRQSPTTGNYFYLVSTQDEIFSLMQVIMDSLIKKGEHLQDYALVMECAPLNVVFVKELMNSYKNSERITNEIQKEKDDIAKARETISTGKGSVKRQAKKDLKSALQKQIAGEARRSEEFQEALNLLTEMKGLGFGYLKGIALVKITDIITNGLPNREYNTPSTKTSPQTNNSGQNNQQYNPSPQNQSGNGNNQNTKPKSNLPK